MRHELISKIGRTTVLASIGALVLGGISPVSATQTDPSPTPAPQKGKVQPSAPRVSPSKPSASRNIPHKAAPAKAPPVAHSTKTAPVAHSTKTAPVTHSTKTAPVTHSTKTAPVTHSTKTAPVTHSTKTAPAHSSTVTPVVGPVSTTTTQEVVYSYGSAPQQNPVDQDSQDLAREQRLYEEGTIDDVGTPASAPSSSTVSSQNNELIGPND